MKVDRHNVFNLHMENRFLSFEKTGSIQELRLGQSYTHYSPRWRTVKLLPDKLSRRHIPGMLCEIERKLLQLNLVSVSHMQADVTGVCI